MNNVVKLMGLREQIKASHTREEALAILNTTDWTKYDPLYHTRCEVTFIAKWGPLSVKASPKA